LVPGSSPGGPTKQVEHQVFDVNRPENRLLACTLDKVARMTREPANWRRSHELQHQLAEAGRSDDFAGDLRRWSSDRLMSHYQAVRPWCELILGERNPMSALGEWTGRSLLFPMEKVFDRYVEACLRYRLPAGAKLTTQAASRFLVRQGDRRMFQLKPDFLVEHDGAVWVLDAKWKLVDSADSTNNFGLRQGDFYQLFAYEKRYLPVSGGRLVLIYPECDTFRTPLEAFDLEDGLRLDVVPPDLERGHLPWLH
jgi:5-methylcytosine-specific restriction enzyme subunit McrC